MSELRISPIRMPRWGMAMDEGTVTSWHVPLGAAVRKGDEIVDVESAKAASALEAKGDGCLRRQLAKAGEVIPVGHLIGVIAPLDVDEAEIDAFVEAAKAADMEEAEIPAPQPRRVAIPGGSINLLETGSGPLAVLLVHGFGGNLKSWGLTQSALSESFRVIALDLPGHGDSDPAWGEAGLAEMSVAVLDTLSTLTIDAVHIVGHSMGGAIALDLARRAAERVRSLTLIASAGLGAEIDGSYVAGFLGAKRRRDLRPVIERLFHNPAFVSEQMLEDLVRMKRLDGAEAGLARIAASFFDANRQRHVEPGSARTALDRPHLCIWGAEDRIIPVTHAGRAGSAIILPQAGHMVHIERADAVNRAIADFIARTEREHP